MTSVRLGIVIVLLAALGIALVRSRTGAPVERQRFSWIATAHQFGPVSYRDPAGAISPDGRWMAYSEGRFLRVRPVGGGPSIEFPPGAAQIRHLAWRPDSRAIVADGAGPDVWALYDRATATSAPLWPHKPELAAARQLAWSADGKQIAGIAAGKDGAQLWTIAADGSASSARTIAQRIAWPAWTPAGQVACIATVNGTARVTVPCGGSPIASQPNRDAHGPLTFSPDGRTVFVALANPSGTVDLWAMPTSGGRARQLTAFSRDSYAPSVAADGSVVFKVQSYRTVVAVAPAEGGAARALAAFQSETPSWDPSGHSIGITYGTWRRVPDDAKYPDIAQDAGIIDADDDQAAATPARIVHDSSSEDQSLCWSPNGEWIAFHSHKEESDDIWIRPSGKDGAARRLTMLGRGAEAGWPRWSRDGRWLVFTGASRTTHQPGIYVVSMDQTTGKATSEPREVSLGGLDLFVFHAEWVDDGSSIVAIAKEGPGRHVIFTVPRDGGTPHVVWRVASEHDQPGLGVSPDGQRVAFIAPAPDGFFQVFSMRIAGGPVQQVTTDPSNKTQPAWSPDGRRIAFTVWNYDAEFWRIASAQP